MPTTRSMSRTISCRCIPATEKLDTSIQYLPRRNSGSRSSSSSTEERPAEDDNNDNNDINTNDNYNDNSCPRRVFIRETLAARRELWDLARSHPTTTAAERAERDRYNEEAMKLQDKLPQNWIEDTDVSRWWFRHPDDHYKACSILKDSKLGREFARTRCELDREWLIANRHDFSFIIGEGLDHIEW